MNGNYYAIDIWGLIAALVMLAPMTALAGRGTWGLFAALLAGAVTYFTALVLVRAFNAEEIDLARRVWRKVRRT